MHLKKNPSRGLKNYNLLIHLWSQNVQKCNVAVIIAVAIGQGFCLHKGVLVPDGVYLMLRLTWNWYCWNHNFKLFNWTLRLGKYDIINIVPQFQNSIFPRRSPSHVIYIMKMVPLDSPDFHESNSVNMSWNKMFEILTFTFLPNHVPGTMPSLSMFSHLDSTHFSEFLGILYMLVEVTRPDI